MRCAGLTTELVHFLATGARMEASVMRRVQLGTGTCSKHRAPEELSVP